MNTVKLGCVVCDAAEEEIDIPQAKVEGWTHIEEVQSYDESIREVEPDDPKRSVFDWQTHLGNCPRCSEADRLVYAVDGPNRKEPSWTRTPRSRY